MLRVNNLTGFGSGGIPNATVAFLGFNSSSVTNTTFTFSGESIGTVGNQRHIGVAIHAQDTDGSITINSVTVDGVGLSEAVTVTTAGGQVRLSIWFGAVDTANTTGDIVITFADSAQVCLIGTFECHYILSATATATDTETTDNTQMTATNNRGGIALAASSGTESDGWTWTGSVTDHGDETNDDSISIASGAISLPGTATATANAVVGTNYMAVMATFR